MRAFRRLGHESSELIVPDWPVSRSSACDVVVHLRGLTRRPVSRGQWNVLWFISHPDRVEPGECDDYDVIASASETHARELAEQLGRPVHFLPQATDADSFRPGPSDPDFDNVLYVGNARWPQRRAPRWLMRIGRPFDLYGKNWGTFPESRFVRDEYIPNRDLACAYRSAKVVVADHHGTMRERGFVANRLFDVLASGGVVLSDDVHGLHDVLGDCVPTYSDAAELDRQLTTLVADEPLRRRLAGEGRRAVMAAHTLDHRARRILDLVDAL
jgi:spore maturation protein CgeB